MVNCFTHAKWWKNFARKPEVKMRIQGEDLSGTAQAITDDIDMISTGLEKHLMVVPNDARFYNVKLDDYGIPNKQDVQKAAAECVMVQISLLSNP